jgi:hypothetical protein
MPNMWEEGGAGASSKDEGGWLGRISARWGGGSPAMRVVRYMVEGRRGVCCVAVDGERR